ncbi:MAG: ABC transporter ATP-binding protein, partial [Planctomycetales bacterium]|nr:ABC transporter ATP-binding protein [Planctomycetales bacterium]
MPDVQSSRRHFDKFRDAYRKGEIHQFVTDEALAQESADEATRGKSDSRRRYLKHYLHWLRPERRTVVALIVLALTAALLEMIQPLFMRHIINQVLLGDYESTAQRLIALHWTGALFLLTIVAARTIEAARNISQRLLNVRVLLSLRRALFGRLLQLPLQNLTDMKTGGIISRLSGDIEHTTGLLQLAIISPGVSAIRLLIALAIMLALNWKLAVMAMIILPPALFLSLTIAKRVRPIYRSMRKENAASDARVSETFGGIRVVRSFQREVREQQEYLVRRHTIVRKELFAHKRE